MNLVCQMRPLCRLSALCLSRVLPQTSLQKYSASTKSGVWSQRAPGSALLCPQRRHTGPLSRPFSDLCDLNYLSKTEPTNEPSKIREEGSPQDFSLDVLVALLKQENALDLCVINVPRQINYAHYVIIVSGFSTRHLKAMALYAIKVYKYLKNNHNPHVKIEGKDAEDWMCIDFGDMVVHFMLPESREVYELEKLWTLRSYDEQLANMPVETLPEDFIYDIEVTK